MDNIYIYIICGINISIYIYYNHTTPNFAQVVEFEDLLRPNEAMALLEAARVTAERRLGPGFPRERWRKTMENLGKMRENPWKNYENPWENQEKWRKTMENL